MGDRSMKRAGIAGLALLVFSCSAWAEQPNNPVGPLDNLLKSKTDSVCFRRDYDAAHLKRHPGQMTKTIMLSYRKDGVRIELKQKDRKASRYMTAACDWSENRGGPGHPIPAFTKKAAYDCIVVISPESAEEGGVGVIDPARDGQSLTLYLEDSVVIQDGLAKDDRALSFNFGREDRQFKLTRADAALCKAMDDALELPLTHELKK
jgi:hypothetical protein